MLFSKVNSESQLGGIIRSRPEDFQVDEIPLFESTGQGEHVFLHVKKNGENTDWVAGQLAKIAGVKRRDVSYAGLKDRHAITTQWFSVWLPGKEAPDWQAGLPDTVELLDETRHQRKLKRGSLKGNRFKLVIRDFVGEESEFAAIVERIKAQGVPNYFGEQRFGHNNVNIEKAQQWLGGDFKIKDRQKRSLYLSAARSWLFNHVLSQRVKDNTWNQALPGDVFMLGDSNACFCETLNDEILERVKKLDIHPSGPLWGKGHLLSQGQVAAFEENVTAPFACLREGLENKGLKQQRRSLRLPVCDLDYCFDSTDTVTLTFSLPPGCYATVVLKEIGCFNRFHEIVKG